MIIAIKQVPEATPNVDGEWVVRECDARHLNDCTYLTGLASPKHFVVQSRSLRVCCNDLMMLLSIYRCTTQVPEVPGLAKGASAHAPSLKRIYSLDLIAQNNNGSWYVTELGVKFVEHCLSLDS